MSRQRVVLNDFKATYSTGLPYNTLFNSLSSSAERGACPALFSKSSTLSNSPVGVAILHAYRASKEHD